MTFADRIEGDMAGVADDLGVVTVQELNPVSGAVVQSASNVTVLKRVTERREVAVGRGGVATETCKFHLRASQIPWVPRRRNKVIDAAGVAWEVDGVTIATLGTRYVVETTRVRG